MQAKERLTITMKTVFSAIGRYIKETDWMLMLCCFSLSSFSTLLIYSLYKNGEIGRLNTVLVQPAMALCGIVAAIVLSKIDYHMMARLWKWHSVLCYGLALLVFPFGIQRVDWVDDKAWLPIPFTSISFQPSELAKITLNLFLAAYISSRARQMRTGKGLLEPFLLVLPIVGIVGIENLSTCIILLAISFIMIFVATPLYKPFLGLIGIGVAGAVLLILTQRYRMQRITVWLDPASSDKGEQTMQGLYAIGSGGLFGKGLGQSMQKLGFLPEANNDMIFSVICEELGLFGALCVLALFFALLWRFMVIAINAPDLYGSMLVIGVIAHIGIQVFINIAVATNTMPNTGIPLPFISYGGSSLVFLLLEMGLVLSVSRYIKIKK